MANDRNFDGERLKTAEERTPLGDVRPEQVPDALVQRAKANVMQSSYYAPGQYLAEQQKITDAQTAQAALNNVQTNYYAPGQNLAAQNQYTDDKLYKDYYIPQNEEELKELASKLESQNQEADKLLDEQIDAENLKLIKDYLKTADPSTMEFLVRGAPLRCSMGTHVRKLNLPLCHGVYRGTNPMVHKLDCVVGDQWNIASYGICNSGSGELNSPKIMLQEEAYDEETGESKGTTGKNIKGKACCPAIVGTWQLTYDLTRIVDNGQKDPGDKLKENDDATKGQPSLVTNSLLVCKYGGLIAPMASGQEHVPTAADYKTEEDQKNAEKLISEG